MQPHRAPPHFTLLHHVATRPHTRAACCAHNAGPPKRVDAVDGGAAGHLHLGGVRHCRGHRRLLCGEEPGADQAHGHQPQEDSGGGAGRPHVQRAGVGGHVARRGVATDADGGRGPRGEWGGRNEGERGGGVVGTGRGNKGMGVGGGRARMLARGGVDGVRDGDASAAGCCCTRLMVLALLCRGGH